MLPEAESGAGCGRRAAVRRRPNGGGLPELARGVLRTQDLLQLGQGAGQHDADRAVGLAQPQSLALVIEKRTRRIETGKAGDFGF